MFFPVVLLSGVAKFLFMPLALAVVFAMLTSYLLSRTLVPTMARYLLARGSRGPSTGMARLGILVRAFDRRFERLQERYRTALATFIAARASRWPASRCRSSAFVRLCAVRRRGFFPDRRCRHDEAACARADRHAGRADREYRRRKSIAAIRTIIPADELDSISDNLGLPVSYDLAFYQTDNIGPQDADILISLKPEHQPTADYQKRFAMSCAPQFPGTQFYFQAADIVSQVLNFGLPAPIDIQIQV